MPVLPPEPEVFPEDLFHRIADREAHHQWWVIHTRPRSEKVVARLLRVNGDSYFLPMAKTKRRVQRRLVETQLPLFSGYLFLHGNEEAYHRALKTNKIVGSLHVEDQQRLHQDLNSLNNLMESGAPLSLQSNICVGTEVEITAGALAGTRGFVTHNDGASRIIVEVKMLNQQVSAQIDGSLLTKV